MTMSKYWKRDRCGSSLQLLCDFSLLILNIGSSSNSGNILYQQTIILVLRRFTYFTANASLDSTFFLALSIKAEIVLSKETSTEQRKQHIAQGRT